MDKKSFIIYQNWAEIIKRLPIEDAGELIQAICNYKTESAFTISNPYITAIFEGQIKPKLDEDAIKYAETIQRRSEAGKKGMYNRWNKASEDNKSITNDNKAITNDNKRITNITDTVTDTVTVTDTNNKRVRAVFKPPTIEEVKAYCQERNNKVNAESFIDFYESKGWMVGKNKMKDWKACVRTWEQRVNQKTATNPKIHNFDERNDYDFDELEKRLARN